MLDGHAGWMLTLEDCIRLQHPCCEERHRQELRLPERRLPVEDQEVVRLLAAG